MQATTLGDEGNAVVLRSYFYFTTVVYLCLKKRPALWANSNITGLSFDVLLVLLFISYSTALGSGL